VTAPIVAANPSVNSVSADDGATILVGQQRFYGVHHRGPSPTFCPIPPGNT
jgi:hypothetical protein